MALLFQSVGPKPSEEEAHAIASGREGGVYKLTHAEQTAWLTRGEKPTPPFPVGTTDPFTLDDEEWVMRWWRT